MGTDSNGKGQDVTTTTTTKPRIYVASLSDYNAGRLHGAWIDVGAGVDIDDVWEAVRAMLAASPEARDFPVGGPAEEWAVHDYEDFPRAVATALGEYPSLMTVLAVGAFLAEHGDAGAAFLANDPSYVIGDHERGSVYMSEAFEGSYCGEWSNIEHYAYDLYDQLGYIDDADPLVPFVDWEAVGRDLTMGGDYWTAATPDGGVYVFRS